MAAVRLVAAVMTALLALAVVAACADDGTAGADPASSRPATAPGGAAGTMLAGAGISVREALQAGPSDDPVVVRAFVVVARDGSALICDGLLQSRPPLCGGASMALIGVPEGFLDLSDAAGVRWTEEPAQLVGRVRGDVFENDPESLVAG